jgi:hypothetical protein
MKTALIIGAVGVVAIGAYLVINSTHSSDSECSGTWTDNLNPACWISSASNAITSEANTLLLIVGGFIVLIVALLAFGPGTKHIASAVKPFALL